MRKVIGNISTIVSNSYASKAITFVLCNKYGKEINMLEDDGQIVPTNTTATTDANGNFNIHLFETEKSKLSLFYTMSFVDVTISPKRLYIPEGTTDINFLKTLIKTPDSIKNYIAQNTTLTEDEISETFVENLENYLIGNRENISQEQIKLIKYFILYADGKIENPLMQLFDEHLAK